MTTTESQENVDTAVSIWFQLISGEMVQILDHTLCMDDGLHVISPAVEFAHAAGIEIYVAIEDEEPQHIPNFGFLSFCKELEDRIKKHSSEE